MRPVILLLLVLAGAALSALIWALRQRRALRRTQRENQRLRQILLLGSNSAQQDLNALRKLRHDLRHYLLATDAPEDLGKTLEQPLSGGEAQSWALTSLERYYRQRGEALGFETDIRLNLELPREDLLPDLCLVVSNLLENAVEALEREGGGWLRARSRSAPGYVSLVVGNTCSHTLRTRNGRYLSSKAEGRLGVGLATVQEIARRYGGSSEFFADGKQFRAEVFLPCSMEGPAVEKQTESIQQTDGAGRGLSS